ALSDAELQQEVGETAVYARIAPEHKLRIVRALQARGDVVAVTGDGVNDAPALREAAIGVAMGQTGTDVAKEAADMVLADDNFATIGLAVREGRKLFENLRKAIRYYLAVKVALVSTSLVSVLTHLPVPFTPIQIIVTELFMDLGASVAFTTERAEGDVMARPPRDAKHPFMDGSMKAGIFAGGLSLCVAVTAAYLWAFSRGAQPAHAQSLAFVTWMIGHVLLAFHMRSERQPLLSLGPLSNPAMLIWGIGAIALAVLTANVPVLRDALKMAPLAPQEWVFAAVAPLLTTGGWEVWKLARWRKRG
ncbi:MAG: HAD-IC family P-type ATPase, partial [Chloroflexota bacterium]